MLSPNFKNNRPFSALNYNRLSYPAQNKNAVYGPAVSPDSVLLIMLEHREPDWRFHLRLRSAIPNSLRYSLSR